MFLQIPLIPLLASISSTKFEKGLQQILVSLSQFLFTKLII